MEKERFILNSKNAAALSVSPEDADRLLALDQGEAALLYVYILRRGGAGAKRNCQQKAPGEGHRFFHHPHLYLPNIFFTSASFSLMGN